MEMAESAVLPEGVTRGRRNPLHFTLPARMKKARTEQGLSARALSLRAGLAHNACVGIEGGRIPGVDVAERLARALGCSPCELAYGVQGAPLPPEDALRAAGCGERLRQLREARGLSKLALACAAGLDGSAILPIESGRVAPSLATVEVLAAALQCSPCWLAYGEGADPLNRPIEAEAELTGLRYRPPRSPAGRS
jgi:transcriptional regulator with XRE-family HTH domain